LPPSAFCLLLSAYCLLPTAYCLPPTAFRLLPSAFCLPPSSYCLPPTAFRLLPTAFRLLPSAYCLPPSAFCLPPTAFCLLPTAFCLLLSAFCLLLQNGAGSTGGRSLDFSFFCTSICDTRTPGDEAETSIDPDSAPQMPLKVAISLSPATMRLKVVSGVPIRSTPRTSSWWPSV